MKAEEKTSKLMINAQCPMPNYQYLLVQSPVASLRAVKYA